MVRRTQDPVYTVFTGSICRDLYPVSVTESFGKQFGITRDDMQTDIGGFLNHAGPGKDWKLWKKYRSWDGKQPLTDDFYMKRLNAWYRLEVMRSKDGQYDTFRFRDITQDREALEEAREQLKIAENVSQSKTEFCVCAIVFSVDLLFLMNYNK